MSNERRVAAVFTSEQSAGIQASLVNMGRRDACERC